MRVIATKNLNTAAGKQGKAKQALLAWYREAENASWAAPKQVIAEYTNAIIISPTRAVFPLQENSYYLIADIDYRLQLVCIVWIGTKRSFEQVNVKKIQYA